MKANKHRTLLGHFLILPLLLAAIAATAQAHGGGTPQLVNQETGPYLLSVWTAPDPPQVGEMHLTIGLARPGAAGEAGEPVLGADVRIRLESEAGGETLTVRATDEQAANKLFYEADAMLPAAGTWTALVSVSGLEGEGEANFMLEVEEKGGFNWLLVGGAGALLMTGLVVLQVVRRQGND